VSSTHDQQPIRRTVGKRLARDGRPLTRADRAALSRQAHYRTRAPKGVFIYYSANDESTIDVLPSIAGLSWEEMRPRVTTMMIDEGRDPSARSRGVAEDEARCAPEGPNGCCRHRRSIATLEEALTRVQCFRPGCAPQKRNV
jgi:hypothetical protein